MPKHPHPLPPPFMRRTSCVLVTVTYTFFTLFTGRSAMFVFSQSARLLWSHLIFKLGRDLEQKLSLIYGLVLKFDIRI